MNNLIAPFRAAAAATLLLAVVCGGIYPLAVWGLAQAAFPGQANGSLVADEAGTVRGSRLIGQSFTSEKYFHPRPSAAGSGYDAANSGGSNLGPTSKKLRDAIRERVAAYRAENSLGQTEEVPADAVTASGSGLDPHISPRNAQIQAARVARARGMDPARVTEVIAACTEKPDLGVLGEPRVHVVRLNLALDREKP